VASRVIDNDKQKLVEALQQIKENTRHVMENMGDIIWAIKANQIGDLSFENKLKNYGYELLSPLNIQCSYSINKKAEEKLVNIEARKNILLIAKEAMNNIAKYSHATEVMIRLELFEEQLLLEIADNGKGFDENRQFGNGLQNMQQRGKDLGGELAINSKRESGTSVLVKVPIAKISDGIK
jgi:signal transduction histidine kinase